MNPATRFAQQSKRFAENVKRHQHLLEARANRDEQTFLLAKHLFAPMLTQALAQAKRDETQVCLVILDLDNLKQVNDTAGHPAGDTMIRRVGHIIRGNIRESDSAFRIGGDEFAVIIRGGESRLRIPGVSIGQAVYPTEAQSPEQLIDLADKRMYQQKGGGR